MNWADQTHTVTLLGGRHAGHRESVRKDQAVLFMDSYSPQRERLQYDRCGMTFFRFVAEVDMGEPKPLPVQEPTCPHCGGAL